MLSPKLALEVMATPDWVSLCTRRPNVLLEGSQDWTDTLALFLVPYLRRPVVWKRSEAFAPPTEECGALVLQNVGVLGPEAQSNLLRWLDRSDERKQVVSTTEDPLFPLVQRGVFDEALYYRL